MENTTAHDCLLCEGCLWHEKMCKELLHNSYDFDKQWDKLWKQYQQRCPALKAKLQQQHTHKGNGKHNGIWAGTLTVAPTDEITQAEMIIAIKKLMRQKSCPVKRYVWYLEHTTAGLPHIHFMYETHTGGRIERKHFKRIWKIWDEDIKCGAGHRGGYMRACHSETEYLAYVKKDGATEHEDEWDAHYGELNSLPSV